MSFWALTFMSVTGNSKSELGKRPFHALKGGEKKESNVKPYSFGQSTLKKVGDTVLNNLWVGNLNVHQGSLEFHSLRVSGTSNIEGPIKKSDHGSFGTLNVVGTVRADYLTAGNLHIEGNTNLTNLAVSGDVYIKGSVKISNGNIHQNLFAVSQNLILENLVVENIFILEQPDKDLSGKQKVRLTGNTIVYGNIHFSDGDGIVEISQDAKIFGNVIGGIAKKII